MIKDVIVGNHVSRLEVVSRNAEIDLLHAGEVARG
jgi:hypothetical protein